MTESSRRPTGDSPENADRIVRPLLVLGALGPWVYVLALVVGPLLWTSYSSYGESVSTLTSRGAPNQVVIEPLFALYNVALIAFAVASRRVLPRRPRAAVGPAALAGAGALGLLLFLFPQDPWGAPVTAVGEGHIAISGLLAFLFLVGLFGFWRTTAGSPGWAWFSRGTVAFFVAGIALGAFGAVSVTTPYAGLAERASIGTFLLWTELASLALLAMVSRPSRSVQEAPVGPLDARVDVAAP